MVMVTLKTIESLRWQQKSVLKVQQTQQPTLNLKNILSFRVDLHLKFTSSSVIWILNNTHSSRKIGSVTIMRICWSFSRSKPSLTIAPEFGKTIEKPLISMVDLQKKHSMVRLLSNSVLVLELYLHQTMQRMQILHCRSDVLPEVYHT